MEGKLTFSFVSREKKQQSKLHTRRHVQQQLRKYRNRRCRAARRSSSARSFSGPRPTCLPPRRARCWKASPGVPCSIRFRSRGAVASGSRCTACHRTVASRAGSYLSVIVEVCLGRSGERGGGVIAYTVCRNIRVLIVMTDGLGHLHQSSASTPPPPGAFVYIRAGRDGNCCGAW